MIAIATYKRPEGLRNLLTSLAEQDYEGEVSVLVVDNDAAHSAEDVVGAYGVRYLCEPTAGIPFARNAALRARAPEVEAIAFIDDDEQADRGWLSSLIATAQSTRADIVAGPVIPVLPDKAPWWSRRYGLFELPIFAEGAPVKWPATNNMLLKVSALNALAEPVFDERLATTGGSDSDLVDRIRASGGSTAWASLAVVNDYVPSERARLSWLWRRNVRLGNCSARILLRRHPKWAVIGIGVVRVTLGVSLSPALLVIGGRRAGALLLGVPTGVGTVSGALGILVDEYRR
nr:glycosyltransferase [Mycobacterium sp.]